jgi:aminopeptidase YwaD
MTDDTRRLRRDLDAICACGGRLCGEDSERAAVALLARLGAEATGVPARIEPVVYDGWRALDVSLTGSDGRTYPAHPLVRSAPTPPEGLEAEVIDLGRGTPEEFDAHRDEIAGRIVLVRHELMFAPGTIHRRFKIAQAIAAGAAGFLIAGPAPGHVVAGSARSPGEPGLPALGISPETAAMFARTAAGRPRARMRIATEEAPAQADNLLFDLPAGDGDRIVLSAHIDGHALGESAIDNASGLAVALEAARRVLPDRASWRRGLTLAFFNVEEWALTGSEQHVAAMTGAERERVALNVNLDSVAGGGHAELLAQGLRIARKTVAKIMRENDIRPPRRRRRAPRTTDSRHSLGIAPNLLKRNFRADAPDRVWLADISYVPTDEGWLYLAAVKASPTSGCKLRLRRWSKCSLLPCCDGRPVVRVVPRRRLSQAICSPRTGRRPLILPDHANYI